MRKPEIAGPDRPPSRLTARADFLRAAKGRRWRAACFNLQMAPRPEASAESAPRFGVTVTKKLGNAVLRNRIRRRLKEAVRCAPALSAQPGCDYVIVAQSAALTEDFARLQLELNRALVDIHAAPGARKRPKSQMKD
jgi:ribonuclease P protein component